MPALGIAGSRVERPGPLKSSPKADIHPYNSDVYLGRH